MDRIRLADVKQSWPLSNLVEESLVREGWGIDPRIAAASALAAAVDTYNTQKLLWKPAHWAPVAEALTAYRSAVREASK